MSTKNRCQHKTIRNTARRIVGSIYDCGYGQVYAYGKEAQDLGEHKDEQTARKAVWDAYRAKESK